MNIQKKILRLMTFFSVLTIVLSWEGIPCNNKDCDETILLDPLQKCNFEHLDFFEWKDCVAEKELRRLLDALFR